ncbi:hypothetical protein GJQ54_05255 [Oceanospirillaceae bacterium ASx5O]|nr:hypothetical protein GJQ54_05255 [Oceanospirillaceae bacterium ASx5O]
MAYKKSVRITDAAAAELAAFSDATGEGMNWSGSINAMAEYVAIVNSDLRPELTENQWRALYCCYNGYVPHPNLTEEAKLLPWHIDQGYQYDEQIQQLLGSEEEARAFVKQVQEMTLAERLAVICAAKKFWRQSEAGGTADE